MKHNKHTYLSNIKICFIYFLLISYYVNVNSLCELAIFKMDLLYFSRDLMDLFCISVTWTGNAQLELKIFNINKKKISEIKLLHYKK